MTDRTHGGLSGFESPDFCLFDREDERVSDASHDVEEEEEGQSGASVYDQYWKRQNTGIKRQKLMARE